MSHAAVNPTLPQNDNAAEQARRAAQIVTTSANYIWTKDIATLEGVPLAATVPKSDDPTLEWFIILAKVGLEIARNAIAVKLSGLGSSHDGVALITAQARCGAIETSLVSLSAHHDAKTGGNIFKRVESAVEESVEYLDQTAHLALLKDHVAELRAMIELTDAERHSIGAAVPPSLEAYRALFDTLDVPGIAYMFQEDDVFARLRVAGPNAMLIKGIAALPNNFALTPDQYAAVVNGDTLSTALSEGRIYLCDYDELKVLVAGKWDGIPKYVYRPMALFAVPPGGASIVPVAIQCGQEGPVFTPTAIAGDKWGWEMAKLVVQVADGNYHELFVHLARTHLVLEAFAVATHRNLATVHPIWGLLVPHYEGSLFINNQAAGSLIAANGPIDHIFGGTITSSQQAAVEDRLAFDFYTKMLPADLAERNVNDTATLVDYPYRDDALLVWQAINQWATQYVNIYYASDDAVLGDTELAAWATSITSEGLVAGFTPITSRQQLADVCTMIIFTASAQHAAVNFPQKDVMSFAPAVTGAGWAAAPTEQSGHHKQGWLGTMPPLSLALEQLNTLYLLGSVHYRPLGDYRSNDIPYNSWFRDPEVTGADCALPCFQATLQTVEDKIAVRNAERMWPYPYLLPSLIPTSINI